MIMKERKEMKKKIKKLKKLKNQLENFVFKSNLNKCEFHH